MKVNSIHRYLFLYLICTFCLAGTGIAQYSNTMYFMKGVPQANMLNPAFQPACNLYIGVPAVSPLQVGVGNSALSASKILTYDKELDSTITPFHPRGDKNKFLNSFDPLNTVSADVNSNLLSFGFRSRNMYFSFQLSQRAYVRMIYPEDLMRLPIYFTLDEQGNPYDLDLSGFGLNASVYTETALGMSYKLSDNLSVGARLKFLLGEANLSTTRSDITVDTEFDDNWIINSNLRADASLPLTSIPRDSTGDFDFKNIDVNDSPSKADVLDAFLYHPNTGLAIDLGVTYKPLDWLRLSASVTDLGYIRWKNSTYNIVQNTRFEFKGIEMTDYINGKDTTGFGDALLDTLKNSFEFNSLEDRYITSLPTQVFLGGDVQLTKGISLGALAHMEFYQKRVYSDIIMSANLSAGRALAFSLSYSLLHNEQRDVGIGLAFKPGPVNLYLIFDNIPTTFDNDLESGLPIPVYMKGFNVRIGLNFIFGCNKQKKINKDMPLVD